MPKTLPSKQPIYILKYIYIYMKMYVSNSYSSEQIVGSIAVFRKDKSTHQPARSSSWDAMGCERRQQLEPLPTGKSRLHSSAAFQLGFEIGRPRCTAARHFSLQTQPWKGCSPYNWDAALNINRCPALSLFESFFWKTYIVTKQTAPENSCSN